jgi:4-hydroxy-tetrahydrodipicolinate reductase
MVRLVVNGARGRMGRMVLEAASTAQDVRVVAIVEAPGHPEADTRVATPWGPMVLRTSCAGLAGEVDAAIDFSIPQGAVAFIQAMAAQGIPVVSGTTGLSSADLKAVAAAAEHAPVLWAANTSIGVFALHELAAMARRLLGPSYDIEVVEVHHRHKRDAPSGTALSLARRLVEDVPRLRQVTGREGECGPRKDNELGVLAVRGGEVVGDHTVHFLGDHDRIEITHRAASRNAFAQGALMLAQRLIGRPAGMVAIADLLAPDPDAATPGPRTPGSTD